MIDFANIRGSRTEIDRALIQHDAQRKILEGQLLAVRHACPHPNPEQFQTSCMGDIGHHWKCTDCGLDKST